MSLVSYVGATPLNRVDTQNRNTYVATAGQTMFPAVYTPGYVDVYKNGSKLRGPTGFAFTAIDGTSVVLTTEAVEGDVIEIVAIRASTPYDFYNKSQADFLAGNFYAVAGGSSDALLLTLSPLPTSLPDGIQFKVMTAVANTTTMPSVTIANLGISKYISGPGATPLYAGAWIANQCITLRYNLAGDRFEFLEFGTKGLQSNTMQKYTSSTTLTSADFGRLCFWAPSVPTSGLLMMPNAIGANGKIISVYCMGPGKVTLGSVGVNSLVAFGTSTTWVDLNVGESIGLCSDGINWIQVWGNRDSIPSANRTNWGTKGNSSAVVGQLGWSKYGDNHTIFDASSGVSPSGTTVDVRDSSLRWVPGFPTLMGWNGIQTYGIRVDSALVADKLSSTRSYAPSCSCRAYVNFNGVGGAVALESLNVSSIINNGGGVYTVNFTTGMINQYYAVSITSTFENVVEISRSAYHIQFALSYMSSSNYERQDNYPGESSSISVAIFQY